MSLRRQLLVSMGVQGLGAASVLIATLWLGAAMGPEVQGAFSRSKAEVAFVAAFAMWGLPQALFYFLQRGELSRRRAVRWALVSAALAVPLGLLYELWRSLEHGLRGPWLMGAAVGLSVAHGQLRVLLLAGPGSAWFNALTALPQAALLVGVAAVIALGTATAETWLLVILSAFLLATVSDALRLRATPAGPTKPHAAALHWSALAHYGLAAWLTASLSTGASLFVQGWVEGSEGAAALGRFTTAMTLVMVPLVPVGYAAPLLLRRWIEQPDAARSRRWAAGLLLLLLTLAAVVAACAPLWPDLGLGPGYAGVTTALAVLMAGGAAEAASRLLTVQASAAGQPWMAVRAELARAGVLALAWCLPLPAGLLPRCAAWSLACWASAAVLAWAGRASTPAPTPAPNPAGRDLG